MSRGPWGRWSGATALVIVCLAAGCGGSDFRYVANTDDGFFFRVPDEWRLFDESDLLGDRVAEGEAPPPGVWMRGFDAAPSPSADNVLQYHADQPHGVAMVAPLEPAQRDAMSFELMRQLFLGFDPAKEAEPGAPEYALLALDDLSLDNGARGIHQVVRLATENGPAVIDVSTVVDPETTRMYVFSVSCSEACYTQHRNEIEQVVDSWTLGKDT